MAALSVGAFGVGFAIGALSFGRIAGITLLGITGGMSIGVRIILFRPGLLVPVFYVNWLIITVLGVVGFLVVLMRQRAAIVRLFRFFSESCRLKCVCTQDWWFSSRWHIFNFSRN